MHLWRIIVSKGHRDMKQYVAVIGDIRNSKGLHDRGEVQQRLGAVLDEINEKYSSDIAAKFLITLGDEFQGLLSDISHLLEIIRMIQRHLYPVDVRFGIGIGEITTAINKEAAIGADGPAYYAARNMIDELRVQEKKLKNQAPDIMLEVYGRNDDLKTEQINGFLRASRVIENGWSEDQRNTIMDMIDNGGSQSESAERLKTTQSTVARRLASGNYITYRDIEEIANRSLGEMI